MNKTILLIILGGIITGAVPAEEKPRLNQISFGAAFGVLYGQAEEIVYTNSYSDNFLSQLLWDMKPLFYAGPAVEYILRNRSLNFGFFIDASVKWGIPEMYTGVMEDRDWTNSNYPSWLTHYSVHNNITNSAMLIEANLGVTFSINKNMMLKPAIAYRFMSFSWTAGSGSILYPSTENNPNGHFYLEVTDQDVIRYQQEWHIFAPALSFYGQFNRFFSAEIAIKASPLLSFSAKDEHILRELVFRSSYANGFFLEPSLVFSWMPFDWGTISLSASYRHISGPRGDVQIEEQGIALGAARNTDGSGYAVFDIGIIAKLRLSF
jgi:outer membrane protease